MRAPDPYTVEYELNEPYSDLLLQLTMFTNVIHNKDSVEALGKDYGIKGIDGTGPWCFASWQPRTEILLKRHDAYNWGPAMYKNPGPVKFERLSIKIVPEDSSRLAAMMAGQFDITTQFPSQFIAQAKASPSLDGDRGQAELPAALLRLQGDPADGGRQARARGDEHRDQPRRDRSRRCCWARPNRPTPTSTPNALDFAPKTKGIIKEDVERANRLLDEAGWKKGADGIRNKDGERLAPVVFYHGQSPIRPRMTEAIQGYCARSASTGGSPRSRLDHHAGQDGRAGLRNLDGDGAVSVGRRPDELLLRLRATSRRPTG